MSPAPVRGLQTQDTGHRKLQPTQLRAVVQSKLTHFFFKDFLGAKGCFKVTCSIMSPNVCSHLQLILKINRLVVAWSRKPLCQTKDIVLANQHIELHQGSCRLIADKTGFEFGSITYRKDKIVQGVGETRSSKTVIT